MKNFPNRESDDVLIIWKQFISTVENDLEIMMFLMDGDGFLSFSIYSYVERESKSPGFNSLSFSSNKRTNTFRMTLSVAQIIVEDFLVNSFLHSSFKVPGFHWGLGLDLDWTTSCNCKTSQNHHSSAAVFDTWCFICMCIMAKQSPLFSLSFFVQIRIRIL